MGPRNMIAAHRQHGFVLFMTLVMLVILTISGLALMQVMGAGVSAAGNIAFRQASVRYADLALEGARTWLMTQSVTALHTDMPGSGYTSWVQQSYPTNAATDFNPKTLDWTDAAVAHQFSATDNGGTDQDIDGDGDPTTFSGYRIYYVVHRMANQGGVPCSEPGTGCMFPSAASSSTTAPGTTQSAGTGYSPPIQGNTGNPYYRITAKVVGPRHNTSYVQAIMH
jgi:type II secretory pathway pseudopilin PulG